MSDENLKDELREATNKLHKQDDVLDSHVRILTQLETEKLDLVEGNQRHWLGYRLDGHLGPPGKLPKILGHHNP